MRTAPSALSPLGPEDVQRGLVALVHDRHSADARLLFTQLMAYAETRLQRIIHGRYADLLTSDDREELLGEVLFQLMNGALMTFRGTTIGELLAFVRCICDRQAWRAARKALRERTVLDDAHPRAAELRDWTTAAPPPDAGEIGTESPLDETDTAYLRSLLEAGSRAEFARRTGVSRAAVTQRIQRIRRRIEALPATDREDAEQWLVAEASRFVQIEP